MPEVRPAFIWIGASLLLFVLVAVALLPGLFKSTYSASVVTAEHFAGETLPVKKAVHLPTPDSLKALYMTACVASDKNWRVSLKTLIETTELNAVVIDIKDYTGTVSFPNNFPKTLPSRGCVVPDIEDFIAELHAVDIYVIGRVSVFQDVSYSTLFPDLAVKNKAGEVWKDYKGLSFIDVGAKPYWDYILEISNQSYELGFDELNYDYVRYPSDGNMEDTNFTWMTASSTKAEMLESFFYYLSENVPEGVKTSVDLFGMTTTANFDLGIGQVLEKALPYFDYIAPMVYPSHYPPNWNGFINPAEKPYEVIKIAMSKGREREVALNVSQGLATTTASKLRPWLQDFNLGATYDAAKVQAQIQATYDSGLTGWMLWNASNRYTKEALQVQ